MACCFLPLLTNAQRKADGLKALSGNRIRIVSYNLLFEKKEPVLAAQQWKSRVEVVKSMFHKNTFDIIGTQEALTFQVNDLLKTGEYGRVGGDLGTGGSDYPYAENEALFYRKSRFEVLESGNIWFSLTPDRPGTFAWDAKYPRMCTWGKFKEKRTGKVFYVFNSHFHLESPVSRLESARIVLAKVEEVAANYPVFCTGDFNSERNSESLQTLLNDGILHDSRHRAKQVFGAEGTYHGFNTKRIPDARIDFILTSDRIKVLRYGVLDEELTTGKFGSDHLPVVVDAIIP